ncbi:MAG TPA: hypothetical protein VFL78_01835 [Rhodanobacteraceae bacterium]|nr:hypothetical protein [Rhodanobacteraceae bacterium]
MLVQKIWQRRKQRAAEGARAKGFQYRDGFGVGMQAVRQEIDVPSHLANQLDDVAQAH